MLSIKRHTPALLSSILTLHKITLIFAVNIAAAVADNDEIYRQEPITPLPQNIAFNEAKANLGEKLFFDTRLSKNNTIACASCHQLEHGGDDNVAMGLSISADKNIINTPTVFNARYNFRQNWNGDKKTLQEQIDAVMKSHHEFDNNWSRVIASLAKDDELKTTFDAIYADGINKSNIVEALVEFENTLVTPNSRFDRYLRNEDAALTKNEKEGYRIFKEIGCISCHQGINIGGNLYQKFGVYYNYIAERGTVTNIDYGRKNFTRRQMDAFVFKVPSLRNIAVTAPYLHDGSAQTIEEAISIMGKTQLGKTLTENEIALIKAFLFSLTGEYKNRLLDTES